MDTADIRTRAYGARKELYRPILQRPPPKLNTERSRIMQGSLNDTATAQKNAEPPKYEKRIGSTVYRLTVHFSQTSTDTIEDKLLRLMEGEVRESA